MAVKVTYTLDDETVRRIRRLAERHRKPQSAVVREAVAQFAAHEATLTPEERERKLAILREIGGMLPTRSDKDIDRELKDIRRGRRTGWRRPTDE
jgi:hypothetical protein